MFKTPDFVCMPITSELPVILTPSFVCYFLFFGWLRSSRSHRRGLRAHQRYAKETHSLILSVLLTACLLLLSLRSAQAPCLRSDPVLCHHLSNHHCKKCLHSPQQTWPRTRIKKVMDILTIPTTRLAKSKCEKKKTELLLKIAVSESLTSSYFWNLISFYDWLCMFFLQSLKFFLLS